ncbi:transcription elongation factor GreAB [Segetibacter sp. 3557_3]|uniref:GreA/GreB family elongation factor n=1 Tax=Segetibacter sp. 3557_3 TaxID=2547429 RepID=UPI001058DD71|nr:GreA/GreB family elongation factor [Segetibacter sp. 3557_3]TDH18402.1 transcription elongation factor GreAB [Segetibacter sp. 3557_3]
MKQTKGAITIAHDDYETLSAYVKGLKFVKAFDKSNAALLNEELKKATLVKKEDLPNDVVRLNSRVIIKEGTKSKLIELVLVVPEKADIKEKKVSVFAPIGTALLGFRQGEKVKWDVPAGSKTFTIMKVENQESVKP